MGTLSPEGEASLMAVTLGKVQWAATQATSSACGASNVLIGGGLPARSGSGVSIIYNETRAQIHLSTEQMATLKPTCGSDRSTLTSTRAALCTTTSSGLRSIMMRQHQTTFFTRVNCGS